MCAFSLSVPSVPRAVSRAVSRAVVCSRRLERARGVSLVCVAQDGPNGGSVPCVMRADRHVPRWVMIVPRP